MAGEYTGGVVRDGLPKFVRAYRPDLLAEMPHPAAFERSAGAAAKRHEGARAARAARPPSFCTGCPERPIFAAMKLVERELGPHHVSCDIGCHLFSILPPFNIGNTTMGYGLGGAGASAFNVTAGKRAIAIIGDGGFWHNGLALGVGNAVFNKSDNVHDHRRQRLLGRDRRPGHPVLHRRQHDPLDQEPDREGGARRRRQLGAHAHAHLRRRQDARHAAGGADHRGGRARRSSSRSPNAC